MALGAYVRKSRVQTDRLRVDSLVGHALLVKVREFRPDFSSQQYPTPKPVVIVDVLDLSVVAANVKANPSDLLAGAVFIGPLWGAEAVVDGLKDYAGSDELIPVMVGSAVSPSTGRTYCLLDAIEDDATMQFAAGVDAKFPDVLDERRAQREAQADEAAVKTGPVVPTVPKLTPMGQVTPAQPAQADNPFPATPAAPVADGADVAAALAALNA